MNACWQSRRGRRGSTTSSWGVVLMPTHIVHTDWAALNRQRVSVENSSAPAPRDSRLFASRSALIRSSIVFQSAARASIQIRNHTDRLGNQYFLHNYFSTTTARFHTAFGFQQQKNFYYPISDSCSVTGKSTFFLLFPDCSSEREQHPMSLFRMSSQSTVQIRSAANQANILEKMWNDVSGRVLCLQSAVLLVPATTGEGEYGVKRIMEIRRGNERNDEVSEWDAGFGLLCLSVSSRIDLW